MCQGMQCSWQFSWAMGLYEIRRNRIPLNNTSHLRWQPEEF
jgi:hypothetical protein